MVMTPIALLFYVCVKEFKLELRGTKCFTFKIQALTERKNSNTSKTAFGRVYCTTIGRNGQQTFAE